MIEAPELISERKADDRRLNLSTRLRWALAGIALFVVPTAGLMVWTLARVHSSSQAQAHELALVAELELAWDSVRSLELDSADAVRGAAALEAFDRELEVLAEERPLHAATLGRARAATAALATAVAQQGPVAAAAAPQAGASILARIRHDVEVIGEGLADVPVRGIIRRRTADLSAAVSEVRAAAVASSTAAAADLRAAVDSANRNLVTIALAMLVYLAYLLIFLPSRLLASFARIRATLRQARSGDLTLRAPTEGDDDAAVLAREFNAMMEVIERFDHRKRQRIYQDSQVLRRLGERAGFPFALLGLEGRIDSANTMFWALFGLEPPQAGERPHVSDVMGSGSRDLSDLLARSLEARRIVKDHPVIVHGVGGAERRFSMSIEPIRSTDARLTHLLMILEAPPSEAFSTARQQPPGAADSRG